jgi:ADP-ribose pyrophosphatase YjhB (NUDIX family)
MDWKYCPYCAGKLEVADKHSKRCTSCGKLHYHNPKSTVGVIFFDKENRVVLGIRGGEPGKGLYDVVGGFVDLGESLEEALTREIKEETGLAATLYTAPHYMGSLYAHYDFMGYDVPNNIALYFSQLFGDPQEGDDVAGFVRWKKDEIEMDKLSLPEYKDYILKGFELLTKQS